MPLTWSGFENVKILLCSSKPDIKVSWWLYSNVLINQKEVPILFLLREVQREYIFACFKEVRRWGQEWDAWKSASGCLWKREKQKKPLPYFSPASPASNTFTLYQWTLRTKCAQGKEIKIAKQFPFLSTELTEKKMTKCLWEWLERVNVLIHVMSYIANLYVFVFVPIWQISGKNLPGINGKNRPVFFWKLIISICCVLLGF